MGYLRAALKNQLTSEELELLPAGFDRVGHVVIISLPQGLVHRIPDIAQALLKLKDVRTVTLREGAIVGRHREPKLRVIAGDPSTETVVQHPHRETREAELGLRDRAEPRRLRLPA